MPNERLISAEQIFSVSSKEKNKKIQIADIQVKRIKSIAMALGYSEFISMREYLNIQAMIINAEEPFYDGTTLVFPRIELVKMLENKKTDPTVYQKYANEILSRNKSFFPNLTSVEREVEGRD